MLDDASRTADAAAHDGWMLARVVLVVAVVAVSVGLGLWWRAREGAVRTTGTPRTAAARADTTHAPQAGAQAGTGGADTWRARGVELGTEATFVQFSTDFCSPCRATSRVLHALVADRPGVVHAELDIDHHLALVRELSVLRAPTVVVLDPDGAEVARMSGAVSKPQAEQALGVVTQAA